MRTILIIPTFREVTVKLLSKEAILQASINDSYSQRLLYSFFSSSILIHCLFFMMKFHGAKPYQRWRLAFIAIYFTKVLDSLTKKIFEKNIPLLGPAILRSPSFISVDVQDVLKSDSSDHVPFFNIDQKMLTETVRDKDFERLHQFGGIKQLVAVLKTDEKDGIDGHEADLKHRRDVFGSNQYRRPPKKSFFSFVVEAFKDTIIIILMVCAILSLGFGIKQEGIKEGWYDGGSIVIAIFLTSDIKVQVVDESSMTGESDHVEINDKDNPFLFSGTKVSDGFGTMLVTSVGMNTAWGEMMSSIRRELDEQTPLQARLDKLASTIGKLGLAVALIFNGSKTNINDGLPLAVTLSLAYSMKRMMADQAMMKVVEFWLGNETAILTWAVVDLGMDIDEQKQSCEILHVEAFNSEKKRSGVLMILATDMAAKSLQTGMTLLGLVGLKDPCRPGVRRAVEDCRDAGVKIKMITGDNIFTAKAIAMECDGTNDAPALKEADIGLSMGIQGTEVAKESSDIVILDDNFTSVVTVLRWGRCVYNNIQKFIQFQLTVNVAALVINFVAAVSSGDVPLTAVQLLWVNLIMDTLGALALATERPTNDLLKKSPVGRTKPLISNVMWRNLIAQALYQVAVLLILQFKGKDIFNVDEKVKNTLIFNTFVLCQVFNEFNARHMEKKNVFADTVRLNWGQWGACIAIASLSWPIAWLVKCLPVSGKRFLIFPKPSVSKS
ncbi:unnamed protein product, partial [Vitis vinifera]